MIFDKKVLREITVPLVVIVCSTIFMLLRFGIASVIFTLPANAGLIVCFWGLIFLHHLRVKEKAGPRNVSLYLAILVGIANIIHGCILLYYSGVFNRPGSAFDILGYFFMPFYTAFYMIGSYLAGSVVEALIRLTLKPYRQEDIVKLKRAYGHVKKYKLIYGVSIFCVFLYSAYHITMMYLPSIVVNPFSDIHYAAQLGNINQVRYFLDKGVDINVPEDNDYRNTPLHIAALHEQDQMIEFLIKHGANINAGNAIDATPLHTAARGSIKSIILLIKLGADINAQDKYGDTPLNQAARRGHLAAMQQLIDHGADVNMLNNMNQAPLFKAVWYGYYDAARLLIESGANVNIVDKRDRSFLDAAREHGYKKIEKLLIEHGAK